MRLNDKRQADDELQANRASKRQATIPTTRMTRSSRKLNERSGISVLLNPGLPMGPRTRRKPPQVARTKTVQQECIPGHFTSRANSSVELTILPATTYVPALHEPTEKVPVKAHSVIYAVGTAPDGREICAPIRIGSDRRDHCRPEVSISTGHGTTKDCSWLEAANPGGPAPIAYMSGDFHMATTNTTDAPTHKGAQRISIHQRRKIPSHRSSSLISPRSGPVKFGSIPIPSRADVPRLACASGLMNTGTPFLPEAFTLDWTMLNPDWLNRSDEMWMASRAEPDLAVTEAFYPVDSLAGVAELLENEIDAQSFKQDMEPPIVEIFASEPPYADIFHEDPSRSHIEEDFDSVADIVYGPSDSPLDAMIWSASETTEVPELDSDTVMSGLTMLQEHVIPSSLPTAADASHYDNTPSERGSSPEDTILLSQPITYATAAISSKKSSGPSSVDILSLLEYQQKAEQQVANLQREKELRMRLIASRKARKTAPLPCIVRNVLVRKTDGSMSIITTGDPQLPNWAMEEDQYSVEEYEEDTVSY